MYVFGIDMPIMELLFILMLALIVTLIIFVIEIRKLRKLILIEQSDIYKFEQNFSKMKPAQVKKHSKALDDFVMASRRKGLGDKDISRMLTEKGWPKELIKEALSTPTMSS